MFKIIFSRYTAKLGMGSKEVIQVISEIGQADYCQQAENSMYYLNR